jgi:hypothetical protein
MDYLVHPPSSILAFSFLAPLARSLPHFLPTKAQHLRPPGGTPYPRTACDTSRAQNSEVS